MELINRKTARQYYSDPLFRQLLDAVFKKYRGQNGVKGNAKFRVASVEEATRLQNFFGNRLKRMIKVDTEVEVPLKIFEEELQLGYKLDIQELYQVLYHEELLTNAEKKQLKNTKWTGLFDEVRIKFNLQTDMEFGAKSFSWLDRLEKGSAAGYRVLLSAFNKGEDSVGILIKCVDALRWLLVKPGILIKELATSTGRIMIPIFSNKVTQNPHAFDWKEPAGRLLWYALYDIYNEKVKTGLIPVNDSLMVPEYMQKRQIYRHFMLMDDDISSISYVFAKHFITGLSPRPISLKEIESCNIFPFYTSLLIFENPSVFSYLVDEIVHFLNINGLSFEQIFDHFPVLVCTSGQPQHASKEFIRRCLNTNPNCVIYYSGDIDLPGVQMMRALESEIEVNFRALKMDVMTYNKFANSRNLTLSTQDKKVLSKNQNELEQAMWKFGVKVYQEALVAELKEEVIGKVKEATENYIS